MSENKRYSRRSAALVALVSIERALVSLGLGLLFLLVPLSAEAQGVVVNPSTLTFTASADQNTTIGTVPVLTDYTVQYYQGTVLVKTSSLGKPTPNASNDISVPMTSTGLQVNKVYTLTVSATGPGGTNPSAQSLPFAYLGAPAAVTNIRLVP